MKAKENWKLDSPKIFKFIIICLAALVLGLFVWDRHKEARARELVLSYRFEEAMEFLDENKFQNEKNIMNYMYRKSEGNEEIYKHLVKNGYEIRVSENKEESRLIEESWRLETLDGEDKYREIRKNLYDRKENIYDYQYVDILENFKKYDIEYDDLLDFDIDSLDFFDKLYLLKLVDDQVFKTKVEESIEKGQPSYENFKEKSADEKLRKYFIKEMEEKGIDRYSVIDLRSRSFEYLVVGQVKKEKAHIYSVDRKNNIEYRQEILGEKIGESIRFYRGLLLPLETELVEFLEAGKTKVVSFAEIKKNIEIIESELEDDLFIGDGKISSKELNQEIEIYPGRTKITLESGKQRTLYKVFRIYDENNNLKNIVIAEYRAEESGKLKFKNLRLGI